MILTQKLRSSKKTTHNEYVKNLFFIAELIVMCNQTITKVKSVLKKSYYRIRLIDLTSVFMLFLEARTLSRYFFNFKIKIFV